MNFRNFISSGYSRFSQFEKELQKCNHTTTNISDSEFPIYKVTINENCDDGICLVGCIHGNEIAGTTSLLRYLQNGIYPENKRIDIIPLLNPSGFIQNTRQNNYNIDLNRDYCKNIKQKETLCFINYLKSFRPKILWTLHEDQSCDDFYLYYSDKNKINLWKQIVDLASNYFNIRNEEIHGDDCINGLICHPTDAQRLELPKHKCSLENMAYSLGINYLTTETPRNFSLSRRTLCNKKIIELVLNQL